MMKHAMLIKMAMLLALVFVIQATKEESLIIDDENLDTENMDTPTLEPEQQVFLRGTSRFLAQKPRATKITCDKNPRICRAKGSPGPDCCKKKCVNVMTDNMNCGLCGKKCKYSEICCKGKCVNPRSDKKHCGSCGNKCTKGNVCVHGMCSYAT
ncbi:hypothetical protein L2E82_41019 [Cichorium intybus]|uniref:Uncharacterized protein n=1 Tax=Cichorium intybus TaxID=13427 RepID=A0ACB9ARS5_CICIN|nr:hypothetical protein L2E82_41019 [Cichorium intybus]